MSKPSSRGNPLRRSAEADVDLAQGAVVHVDHAAPDDAAEVEAQLVVVVDVVVDQRRQQVVGQSDGAEIAGEVQVDVFHRHDLRETAAGRAALHAEHRAERRLAQRDHRALADAAQCIAQADRGRRLAFAGRRGADRGDQDQLAVRSPVERSKIVERDLGLVAPVGLDRLFRDLQPLLRKLHDRPQRGGLGDLDIGCHRLRLLAVGATTKAVQPRQAGPATSNDTPGRGPAAPAGPPASPMSAESLEWEPLQITTRRGIGTPASCHGSTRRSCTCWPMRRCIRATPWRSSAGIAG